MKGLFQLSTINVNMLPGLLTTKIHSGFSLHNVPAANVTPTADSNLPSVTRARAAVDKRFSIRLVQYEKE